MIWWMADPGRAHAERHAVADLQDKCSWLRQVSWRLAGLELVVDFQIRTNQRVWSLYMTYPEFFPDVPPQLKSSDGQLLSGHQYGPAGELCLEWRPDNWDAAVTGAMMIESAFRLLRGEGDTTEGAEVPSAHRVTDGQRVRFSSFRLLVDRDAVALLQGLPDLSVEPFAIAENRYGETFVAYLIRIGPAEAPVWEKQPSLIQIPSYEGVAIRVPRETSIAGPIGEELLSIALKSAGIEELAPTPGKPLTCLLIDDTTAWLAMAVHVRGETKIIGYQSLSLPTNQVRLPTASETLRQKRVGIVGCGSIGSKVATSLARTGVCRLLLIDDDILLPGNLVRNDLDWRSVGLNKVVGLKARLLEIEPSAEVEVRQVRLGGQESSESTGAALKALSECDLIIDATADAVVFNLCSAAARRTSKPMVWAKVYSGGIGGIVARVRPGQDPAPAVARNQLSAWWDQQGVAPPEGEAMGYGVRVGDGPPLIADDGDVSVIAAHLTRLAVDTLVRPNESAYGHSAYAVGMATANIFASPFDTYPIALSGSDGWSSSDQTFDEESILDFLRTILPAAEAK